MTPLQSRMIPGVSKLDWALQHAANGRRVFPIARGTKHPLVEWGTAATDDEAQIRAWWTQWPNADIAGATGRGWLVLDVDTKKGHDGERSLRDLESRVGSLDTYTVRTRSGGLHLYFNVDGITKNSEGVLGDGLDTRGDGGFVMLPGSDGYQVIDELPAVTVPDALLEELRRRAPTRQDVLKTAPLDVAEGRRAAYLLSLVSQLREAGADDDLCIAQVERANSELRNPMTHDELRSNVLGSLKRWVRGTVLVKTPPPEPKTIVTATAMELHDRTFPDLESLPLAGEDGVIIAGWSHLLAAFPKVGKTTLMTAIIRDWLKHHSVLYLTEESEQLWHNRLQSLGLRSDKLEFITTLGVEPERLMEHAAESPHDIVVVDTLRTFAGILDESDNAEMGRKAMAWVGAVNRPSGKTLIMLHHERKGGGEHGEGISGGHALFGSVDMAIELKRDGDNKSRRVVETHGRLYEPVEMVVEWDNTSKQLEFVTYDRKSNDLEDAKRLVLEATKVNDVLSAREIIRRSGGDPEDDKQYKRALAALNRLPKNFSTTGKGGFQKWMRIA